MKKEAVVAEFKKNRREVVRAVIRTWNGRLLLDLRVYYPDGEDWLPTPKGLCLQAKLFPDLKAAVLALEKALVTDGESQ